MSHGEDHFEAAYTDAGSGRPSDLAAAAPSRELAQRISPAAAVALKGCVITPGEKIDPGWVVVEGGLIREVAAAEPQGVTVVDTGGVITPGLIDLHGHPEFNVFAPWDPPKQFANRYAWRQSDLYHRLVRDPQNTLLKAVPRWTQLRYAEIRALVGGVTAIQGSGDRATQYQDEALVRNVDKWIFGGQVGWGMIDLPTQADAVKTLDARLADVQAGTLKALYVHLAEGRSDNPRSVGELDELKALNALTPATVIIHGTALSEAQLGEVQAAGAKLVWSPQSNLRLYSETTNVAHALEIGLPVGLGADWLPSGSTSLLAELKVARHQLRVQTGREPDSGKLVDMVTRDAAAIAGLADKLGTLAPQRPADITVFERRVDDPWLNVVSADPSWVELVMIGGDVAYGHDVPVRSLVGNDQAGRYEQLYAWGKPMLLDTSYKGKPDATTSPTLAQLRTDLIAQYPQVGPIFA